MAEPYFVNLNFFWQSSLTKYLIFSLFYFALFFWILLAYPVVFTVRSVMQKDRRISYSIGVHRLLSYKGINRKKIENSIRKKVTFDEYASDYNRLSCVRCTATSKYF